VSSYSVGRAQKSSSTAAAGRAEAGVWFEGSPGPVSPVGAKDRSSPNPAGRANGDSSAGCGAFESPKVSLAGPLSAAPGLLSLVGGTLSAVDDSLLLATDPL